MAIAAPSLEGKGLALHAEAFGFDPEPDGKPLEAFFISFLLSFLLIYHIHVFSI